MSSSEHVPQDSPPRPTQIAPADGRLAVFCVGLGAVATTLIAGVESIRTGSGEPIGSLSQLGTVRLGRRDEQRVSRIGDLVPLASLDQLDFCAWDPFPDDAFVAASRAGVLDQPSIERVGAYLRTIRPLPAVFDPSYVTQVHGPNTRSDDTHRQRVEAIRADIVTFMEAKGSVRGVMVLCGSTEALLPDHEAYHSLEAFEAALDRSDRAIAAEHALRLRRPRARHPLRQLLAEPLHRHAGAHPVRRRTLGRHRRQGPQDRSDHGEDGPGADDQGPAARALGVVLDEHPREPGRGGAPGPRQLPGQGEVQARRAGGHHAAGALPRALRRHRAPGLDQLLPAAGRQQGGVGQHRHLRMARLSDAAQGQLPLP